MSLLAPLGLLALALGGPVLLLHLLRGSRERRVVPSIALWRGAAQQVTARAPWRRPPLSALLLLQLALVLVGALALARPALPGAPAEHLIVVLDASASMRAVDPGQTQERFELARQRAATLLDHTPPGAEVSLIRAGSSPELLASATDRSVLRRALDGVAAPEAAPADLRAAVVEAEHLANQPPRTTTTLVIVSDGAYPSLGDLDAGDLSMRFEPIGASGDNQAVSQVSARFGALGAQTLEGFANIVNYADHPVTVGLEATADGVPLASRRVALEARSQVGQTFSLPPTTRRFGVRLAPGDALSLDDAAETSVASATRRVTLLVTAHPQPLEPALRALPGVDVTVVAPEAYGASPTPDVVVFDEFLPSSLPRAPMLIVDPPPGSSLVSVVGQTDNLEATDLERASPLLTGLDMAAVRFGGPRVDALPAWAQAAASAGPTRLVFSGQVDGQPAVVLAFDPRLAGLDRAAAFPLLVANAIAWATHQEVQSEPHGVDVTPRAHPELTRAGSSPADAGPPREVWPLLAILTLAVCAGEWWYDARHG
jgi:hypothetical protein